MESRRGEAPIGLSDEKNTDWIKRAFYFGALFGSISSARQSVFGCDAVHGSQGGAGSRIGTMQFSRQCITKQQTK
jgi:hypothetical protein